MGVGILVDDPISLPQAIERWVLSLLLDRRQGPVLLAELHQVPM